MVIDVRGNGNPLVGRLRGTTARHEIRPVLDLEAETIYFKPHDAHFMLCGDTTALPDLLTNTERQLVVSKRLAETLAKLDPELTFIPVRVIDRAGKTISKDYAVAVVTKVVECGEDYDGEMIGGYLHGALDGLAAPDGDDLPPIFRVGYALAIACSDAASKALAAHSGVELTQFDDYTERLMPFATTSYELLKCGTEGAELGFADGQYEDELERGAALAARWPNQRPVMRMQGPKSRKKIVDFTNGGGAPVITAQARAIIEKSGLDGIELLPVAILDHAKKPVAGDYWLLHVVGTAPYVDIDESDIEVVHDLLWTAREIVVNESRLTTKPAMFRVPGARYPWVFVRRDVLAAMEAAKLTGFRTKHPGYYAYSVEGSGIPHVC